MGIHVLTFFSEDEGKLSTKKHVYFDLEGFTNSKNNIKKLIIKL
jgi:hypothetical protein